MGQKSPCTAPGGVENRVTGGSDVVKDAYYKRVFGRRKNVDQFDSNYYKDDPVLFDLESYPKQENVNPGTVTVEGFGLEAWEFEESHHIREKTVLVDYADPGSIPERKLLRRIHELQQHAGWSRKQYKADLKEFTGNIGLHFARPSDGDDDILVCSSSFAFLNRKDIFVNLGKDVCARPRALPCRFVVEPRYDRR
ncbi:hypothetical protein N7447_008387 [Penicillium robsamsonii]|uniref:uncharacterized protein n=1 Tax=Penicillium robsamsonii TaxID=1792511 RepID=UPI0025467C8F|nr:uncharacterized protein N7447_008387 [Penicillium robsamsonii]KAJ5816154.1 hypothetical protein N7447_008387 [Penicillium robsamsonii]